MDFDDIEYSREGKDLFGNKQTEYYGKDGLKGISFKEKGLFGDDITTYVDLDFQINVSNEKREIVKEKLTISQKISHNVLIYSTIILVLDLILMILDLIFINSKELGDFLLLVLLITSIMVTISLFFSLYYYFKKL